MDLYIDRNALFQGLRRIQTVVERRSAHPMFEFVLLQAAEGSLRLTATDGQVAYVGEIEANVESPGDLAVDAASFAKVVKSLPKGRGVIVRLVTAAGDHLEITSGRAFFRLPGVSALEYPILPTFEARGRATVSEAVLHRLVTQSSFAVSADDNRYGLNGACVQGIDHPGGPRLRIVGTDGHRLAASEGAYEGEIANPKRGLVPRKALAVLKKLLDPTGEDAVDLTFGEVLLKVTKPGHTFWIRLIDGEFPPYKQVLPSGPAEHRIHVRSEDLASVLGRVCIQGPVGGPVGFTFGVSELVVHTYSADRGGVTESLPIELEGDPITVGFNPRYLSDVLDVVSGEYVTIELTHALAPCVIRDPDRDDAFFVVMPMNLDAPAPRAPVRRGRRKSRQ